MNQLQCRLPVYNNVLGEFAIVIPYELKVDNDTEKLVKKVCCKLQSKYCKVVVENRPVGKELRKYDGRIVIPLLSLQGERARISPTITKSQASKLGFLRNG